MSIKELLVALKDGTDDAKVEAAKELFSVVDDGLHAEILEAGGVPLLAKIIESDSVSDEGKCTAARTLGNLTRGIDITGDDQRTLFDTSKSLVKLLSSGKDVAPWSVTFALRSFAKHPVLRASMINAGVLQGLIELMWSWIAAGAEWQEFLLPLQLIEMIAKEHGSRGKVAVPILVKLLRDGRGDLLVALSAMHALRKIAKDDEDLQAALIEAGAVPSLGELLLRISESGKLQNKPQEEVIELLWELKFKPHAVPHVVIEQAAELFFTAASKERRAAKARIRELESENDDLKRKLPAEIRG